MITDKKMDHNKADISPNKKEEKYHRSDTHFCTQHHQPAKGISRKK
jgi:hypothetical protein